MRNESYVVLYHTMEQKTIVIAGAGFGGLTTALRLESSLRAHADWRIILINRHPYHLFTPALYEVSAVPRGEAALTSLKTALAIPIQEIIAGRRMTFVSARIASIDVSARRVTLQDGRAISCDILVLALGSETNYFGIPGLEEHSYPLKTFDDAVRIRNRIEDLVAEKSSLRVVVGGAGAAGVELAGEFSNFLCRLEERLGAGRECSAEVMLVESAEEILPGFDAWAVRRARRRLEKIGVALKTKTRITAVTPTHIQCENAPAIAYDLSIWTGGVTGNPFYKTLGLPLSNKKTPAVNEFLEAAENIFVVGDGAGFSDPRTGALLPWNVPVAEAESRRVAKNIIRGIRGLPPKPFRPLRRYPYILAVSKKYAIADLVVMRFSGFAGWIAKILTELRYLLSILPPGRAFGRWRRNVALWAAND